MSRDFAIHSTLLVLLFISTPSPAATIAGSVIDNDSNAPISAVTISLSSGDDVMAETQSNSAGEFSFANVVVGSYRLVATKTGYVSLLPTSTVTIADGKPPQSAKVIMTKTCAISGQISGTSGQPLRDIKVVPLVRRWTRDGGTRWVQAGRSAYTDDQGSYRLYGLAPGSYTVAAIPNGNLTGERVFSPVYYPGTAERSRASFIKMSPGENRNGLDFLIDPAPGVRVSGAVNGIPSAWKKTSVAVRLISVDGDAIQSVMTDENGQFVFAHVPRGSYRVVAWGPIFGSGEKGPNATPHGRTSFSQIEADGGETTSVTLELHDLATVHGTVSEAPSAGCSKTGEAALIPLDPIPGADALGAPLTGRGFVIPDVPEGRYQIQLRGLQENCYLARTGTGEQAGEQGTITVSGETKVSLLFSNVGASVSGKVVTPDQKVTPAVVLLMPECAGDLDDGVRFASVNDEGSFRFDNLQPGPYTAVAVRKLDSLDVLDPTSAAESGALHVVAKPNAASTIELKLPK